MTLGLNAEALRAALLTAAERIIESQDLLTKADQAIGDGDHGVGMARGFKAFREALQKRPDATLPEMFKEGGVAIMTTSGGASGVIFGTLFIGAGKALTGELLNPVGFATALSAGLDAVRARGKAEPGDKTMVDALSPACEAALAASEGQFTLAMTATRAADAAERGLEATKHMVAKTGKAKSLGERSLGHIDPGALTFTLFLRSLAQTFADGEAR